MKVNIPPGVFDLIPFNEKEPWKSSSIWQFIEKTIREVTSLYGYKEIRTPIFERTELFQRSSGDESDIVSKEMYTFLDKGGRSLSLRPEGTAPVMRAFVENRLDASLHQKLYYIAPMFRYERSQAGRYRQHHQFGVEAIGSGLPEQDVEVIDLLFTFYQKLGLKGLSLSINSLGGQQTRQRFKKALKEYLSPRQDQLSVESQRRFATNPLRILDSKDLKDQELLKLAPNILNFLSPEDENHFVAVQQLLTALQIPYQVNSNLVRGLDYYNKTVFEVVAGQLGAQNSIGGGGRYDGLLSQVGGAALPSFGFGTGLERIIQTMLQQQIELPLVSPPFVYLIALDKASQFFCFKLLHQLRLVNLPAQMDFSGKKIGKVMQTADQMKASFTLICGSDEMEKKAVSLKEMQSGKIYTATFAEILPLTQKLYSQKAAEK